VLKLKAKAKILDKHKIDGKLKMSEAHYKDLVDNSGIGILIDDEEGQFKYFNKRFAKIFGYSMAEMKGQCIESLVHPDDVEWVMKRHVDRIAGKRRRSRYEFRGIQKDGSIIYLEVNTSTIKEDGNVIGTRSYILNITERKRVEQALIKSEEKYRAIVEDQTEMICRFNPDCTLTFVNESYARYWGKAPGELVGVNFLTLIPEQEHEKVQKHFNSFSPANIIKFQEHAVISGTGDIGWQQWSNRAFFDDEGNIVEFQSVGWDITERKQAEEKLRLLSSAVEQMREGLAVSDLEGSLLFLNNAFATIHGYTSEELVSKHLSIFHKHEQIPSVEAANRQLRETGEFSGEIWHVRRDGTVFPTLMKNSLLRDESGIPIGMVATVRDITEGKRAEEAIRESEERFHAIFEQAPYSIVLIDAETGALVEFNEGAHENLDYTREEFEKLKISDFEVIESAGDVAKHIEKIIMEGADTFETKHRKKGGEIRDIQVITKAVFISGRDYVQSIWRDFTQHKQAESEADAYRTELQSLSTRLMNTLEEERKRISQELHDEMGQALTAIAINLSTLSNSMKSEGDVQIKERLTESIEIVQSMSKSLHELILQLRPSILDDLGLIPTLCWYLNQFEHRTKIAVQLRTSGMKSRVPGEIETAIYRIIQEALTNVAKHAKAVNIHIVIDRKRTGLKLVIQDDGRGFDLKILTKVSLRKRGVGLLGIRERLFSVNGKLNLSSEKGKGTRLEVMIPLGEKS